MGSSSTAREGSRASCPDQSSHVAEISSEQESQEIQAPWGP